MSYKIINRVDPTLYLILSIVGFVIPEQIYKLFLLNPDAVLSSAEATIVRANGVGVIFAALLIFLLGGEEENACLLYTSPSPRDPVSSRMPSSA